MKNIIAIPKVSLHDHLDGGLRPETIIELASERGYDLPANTAHGLSNWFVDSCTDGDLKTYLKTFDLTISVMQTYDELERVAYEFAMDLAADGIIYGEVRWAPELHTREELSMGEAVAAVQNGFDDAVEQLADEGTDLKIGQILCAMRHQQNSLEVARIALEHRDSGVVGFDLAGPEEGFLPELHAKALELLAKNHFPTTIHAGEEGALDSIKSAIFHRALRLGHGTRLAEDLEIDRTNDGDSLVSIGEVAAWVLDRDIAVECCPTSNLQTGSSPWGSSISDHPFDIFYQLGLRVTVSTDNRLMSGVTLTSELALLAEAFGYDIDDLVQFQINAALAAFLPVEERLNLAGRIEDWRDA